MRIKNAQQYLYACTLNYIEVSPYQFYIKKRLRQHDTASSIERGNVFLDYFIALATALLTLATAALYFFSAFALSAGVAALV